MGTPGVALVGFRPEPFAVSSLAQWCGVGWHAPEILRGLARGEGAGREPDWNAGRPEILPLLARHAGDLAEVPALPRFAETFGQVGWDFRMVETDPLIATPFEIERPRAGSLAPGSAALRRRKTCCESACLRAPMPSVRRPPTAPREMIRSRSMNLEILASGLVAQDQGRGLYLAGAFGPSPPLVPVGRFQGRCYPIDGDPGRAL